MVPYGPPDIKFSVEIPKSPFGDIENLTKLAHDLIPPYHRATVVYWCKRFIDKISAPPCREWLSGGASWN